MEYFWKSRNRASYFYFAFSKRNCRDTIFVSYNSESESRGLLMVVGFDQNKEWFLAVLTNSY